MKRFFSPRTVLLLLLLAICVPRAGAQSVASLDNIKSQAELDKAIVTLDAALFDSYNRCDLEKFASFFVEDVEFYHDQGGVTLGRAALTESVKKNICGKTTRELVPGTLQVHYMKGQAPSKWVFTASTIPATKTPKALARPASSTSGNTKMALGKSRASSATTITLPQNDRGAGSFSYICLDKVRLLHIWKPSPPACGTFATGY